MEFAIGVIAFLVFAVVFLTAQHVAVKYQLKKRHAESLYRLEDIVRVSLPPETGEMVAAAIDEELEGV